MSSSLRTQKSASLRTAFQIYPASTFAHSPTFSKWVKLTCADIAGLRYNSRFGGHDPAVFFHLNHPIRYVYIAGTVVATESVGDGRWHLITLDDGSGATIEVKVERVRAKLTDENRIGNASKILGRSRQSESDSSEENSGDENEDQDAARGRNDDELRRTPLIPIVSSTTTPDVSIRGYDVFIGERIIDIGTVVKAKGTLQAWRDALQLKLERIAIIVTSDEEARIWKEYAEFALRVLARPWYMSPDELKSIEAKNHLKREREKLDAHKKAKSEEAESELRRTQEKKRKIYEAKLEKKLQAEAQILDGNPLI